MDSYNLLADGWSGAAGEGSMEQQERAVWSSRRGQYGAAGEGSMGQHEWPIHVFRDRPKGGGGN